MCSVKNWKETLPRIPQNRQYILSRSGTGATYMDWIGLDSGFIGHLPLTILDYNLQSSSVANLLLQPT
jgi:hypothetical protein